MLTQQKPGSSTVAVLRKHFGSQQGKNAFLILYCPGKQNFSALQSLFEQMSSVSAWVATKPKPFQTKVKVSFRAFAENALPAPASTTLKESKLSISAAGVTQVYSQCTASLAFQTGS